MYSSQIYAFCCSNSLATEKYRKCHKCKLIKSRKSKETPIVTDRKTS